MQLLPHFLNPVTALLSLPPQSTVVTLSTDASDHQWGAALQLPRSAASHNQPQEETTNGWFPVDQQRCHITAKETWACLYGLRAFERVLPPGTRIRLQVDAQCLYFALRRMRTKSPHLLPVVKEIAQLAHNNSWVLTPVWVPSADNPADAPSRAPRDYDDYALSATLFPRACQLLPHLPTLDLMATASHKQCPRFVSRLPQPGAVAIDLFAHPLRSFPDQLLYVCPPWGCIQRLLLHCSSLRRDQQLLLVTPDWSRQPWFRHLERIRRSHVTFPPTSGTYVDPLGLPMPKPRWSTVCSVISGADISQLACQPP